MECFSQGGFFFAAIGFFRNWRDRQTNLRFRYQHTHTHLGNESGNELRY